MRVLHLEGVNQGARLAAVMLLAAAACGGGDAPKGPASFGTPCTSTVNNMARVDGSSHLVVSPLCGRGVPDTCTPWSWTARLQASPGSTPWLIQLIGRGNKAGSLQEGAEVSIVLPLDALSRGEHRVSAGGPIGAVYTANTVFATEQKIAMGTLRLDGFSGFHSDDVWNDIASLCGRLEASFAGGSTLTVDFAAHDPGWQNPGSCTTAPGSSPRHHGWPGLLPAIWLIAAGAGWRGRVVNGTGVIGVADASQKRSLKPLFTRARRLSRRRSHPSEGSRASISATS
jgi:hypothetical protein